MPRRLEDEVRAAQTSLGRQIARDRQPSAESSTGITLSPIPVSVEATLTLYERDLNDTLIVGHPDGATRGVGRGRVGDQRGSWRQVEQTTTPLPRAGHGTLAQSLVSAARADLLSLDGVSRPASIASAGSDALTARRDWRFDVDPSSGELRSTDAGLIVDTTFAASADQSVEYRLDVTLTLTPAPETDQRAVLSLAPLVDALEGDTQLAALAFGTGTSQPSGTDSGLDNEVARSDGAPEAVGPAVTLVAVLFRSEPSTQPVDITELALLDGDGDELTRSVFAPETKDDRVRLRARSGIRFIEP